MDLLNDYGSSSDEEEDTTVETPAVQPSKRAPAPAGTDAFPSQKPESILKATSTVAPAVTTAATATTTTTTVAAKRAKKLLSLQAILPSHIYEQLQQQQQQQQPGDSDDDDEEEEAPEAASHKKTATTPKTHHQDAGLQRLLTDLHGTRATATTSTSSSTKRAKQSTASSSSPPERMGAAFLSTSVQTVCKGSDVEVVDIHNSTATGTATTSNKPLVETVMDSGESSSEEEAEEKEEPLAAVPLATTAPRVISAAPRVARRPTGEVSHHAPPPLPPVPATTQPPSSQPKLRRKEMEKLLRSGQLAQASAQVSDELHQHAPDGFVPQAETFAATPAHGVKAVPTQMYLPAAGSTTTDAQHRGRGKNQINALLHQAAHLELQRARGHVTQTSNQANPHRANAKRKYGW